MNRTIHYINRHRLAQYNSIEELFLSVKAEVSKSLPCRWLELQFAGASPLTILKNCRAVKPKPNTVYHITGDVHYMAMALGKQAILTIHDVGSVTGKSGWLKRWYLKLFWFYLPAIRVKYITVISEFTKQELSKIIPFKKRDIQVIHNPVNPVFQFSEKPFNTRRPRVMIMGTKPNKNLNRIFRALQGLPCELMIVGILNAEQVAFLDQLKLHYYNKAKLSVAEVYGCYKDCDLLCFASLYEGFGMPIIEAQAIGRPVITSNIGAMKEVAANTACLVDPWSVESIRAGILKVMNQPDYRERLIQNGLQNVKRFSVESIAQQYQELYEQMTVS